jgi:hypothetical protein
MDDDIRKRMEVWRQMPDGPEKDRLTEEMQRGLLDIMTGDFAERHGRNEKN